MGDGMKIILMFLCLSFSAALGASVATGPLSDTPTGNVNSGKWIYTCYRSFWPELETTAAFARMGIDTRCFFAANAVNSASFEYCKYPLIWKGVKKYDFAAYDKQVDDLLAANPRARLLCMIDLNTPY